VPFAEVMAELEAAGTAQALKTYRRHGVTGPSFGTSFATLKVLMKRIDVDHELALALWDTGNFDARNLAVKIVDPSRMGEAELDRWASEASQAIGCGTYVAGLAGEGPYGLSRVRAWLASSNHAQVLAGWSLVGQLAARDESLPDAFFLEQLAVIERSIHSAENAVRYGMNGTLIGVGLPPPPASAPWRSTTATPPARPPTPAPRSRRPGRTPKARDLPRRRRRSASATCRVAGVESMTGRCAATVRRGSAGVAAHRGVGSIVAAG
jgi:3-methyladenine DNA glycosylase AlkD